MHKRNFFNLYVQNRALIRPGRLEYHIELSLPNEKQRSEMTLNFLYTQYDNNIDLNDFKNIIINDQDVTISDFITSLARVSSGR